jgi:hypothetical protein
LAEHLSQAPERRLQAGRVKVLTANTGSARGWYFFGKKDMSEPRV